MSQFARQASYQTIRLLISLVLWLVIPIAIADPLPASHPEDVFPIINARNNQTDVSRNGLSAIFKMRLNQWKDGSIVTVFVLKDDNPLHKKFSKLVLNVFPHQLRRAWNRAVFSGSGQAPNVLDNKNEMIKKISNTPGAIGYLSPTDINEDIKILNIR